MRIVLIAHNLTVAGGKSVGQNIISHLPKIAPNHSYLIIVPKGCGYEVPDLEQIQVVEFQSGGLASRLRFEYLDLPKIISDYKPDWIWGLGNLGLIGPPCRQSILFQDSHLIYPESYYSAETTIYKIKKRIVKRRLAKCLPKTSSVYCQTETTRKRFSSTFGFSLDDIGICPNAVSAKTVASTSPVPNLPEVSKTQFTLLTLTSCYAHKNLDGIVEMYRQFGDELAHTKNLWTIAEGQHPMAKGLLNAIQNPVLNQRIHNLGPLAQQQLGSVFQVSGALFLPTFLESFSGTYLEAMHFGVPIITSDLDFAHEVCADGAIYVDPWDPASMKDGIRKLADNPDLAADLVQRGSNRLGTLFRSWPEILSTVLKREGIEHPSID